MKAAVNHKYGTSDVLHIEEVPKPKPGRGQVLIEIYAASVNPIDWKLRKGMVKLIYPLSFPAILGFDLCGRVIELGAGVTLHKVGDWVYSRSSLKSGNAYAEFIALDEDVVAQKPEKLSPEEAAAIPLAALTALQGMRDLGGLKSGQTILINGASGGVGTYAVQIAKALGAKVVATCSSKNIPLVESLGADEVIDYKQRDPLALTSGSDTLYPVIFDAVASLSYSRAKRRLQPGGRYITTLPSLGILLSTLAAKLGLPGKHGIFFTMKSDRIGLEHLSRWVQEGKLRSVIDSTFTLDDIQNAHKRSESGRAKGKIVIQVRTF